MKILRQGNSEKLERQRLQVKRFECKNCDCVFDADKTEYNASVSAHIKYQIDYYWCKCPFCGCNAYENEDALGCWPTDY